MRRSRFTKKQIIGILKEHEAGVPVSELCRKHGFSDAAFTSEKPVSAGWTRRRPNGCGRSTMKTPS